MKEIKFRPLRLHKKSGKIIVASYMEWNKVRCANYSEFILKVVGEYEQMDKNSLVHNHKGEALYHFNYSPWDVFVYHGSSIDDGFDWDYLRNTYGSFSINSGDRTSYHWRGADCEGTPTFSHLTAECVERNYGNILQFEPITVAYVLDWLGWFLYHLENSTLKVI